MKIILDYTYICIYIIYAFIVLLNVLLGYREKSIKNKTSEISQIRWNHSIPFHKETIEGEKGRKHCTHLETMLNKR